MKWALGMEAAPDPEHVEMYLAGLICQAFPAYKFHELRHLPVAELMQTMQLMDEVRKARA